MKRLLTISYILIFFPAFIFGQDGQYQIHGKTYIPIQEYRDFEYESLTKEDSLNFRFIHGDTLVWLKNHEPLEGKRVKFDYRSPDFLNIYKKIAFNHKKNKDSAKTTLKYWKDDIKMFFGKSIKRDTKKEIIKIANYLSKNIDSLDINIVTKIEKSNMVLYTSDDYQYDPRLKNYKNSDYRIDWNGRNQINRASIRINTNKHYTDIAIREKLKYLFIDSLGHFTTTEELDCDSYFSKCAQYRGIPNPLDLEILKYHYSYGLCKGLSYEYFNQFHEFAVKHIAKHGKDNFYIIHSD